MTDPSAPEQIGLVRHPLTGRYRLWNAAEDVPGDAAARYIHTDIANDMLEALKHARDVLSQPVHQDAADVALARVEGAIAKGEGERE